MPLISWLCSFAARIAEPMVNHRIPLDPRALVELSIWSVPSKDSDIYQIQIMQRSVIIQWNQVIREKYLFNKNRNLLNKHFTFLVPKAKQ